MQGEMMGPPVSDSLDGSNGGVSSSVGGGSSSGRESNSGTISKIRKKGRQRARAIVRSFQGLGQVWHGSSAAGGATENRSLSLEGDSSVTSGSWSADSSATGVVRSIPGGNPGSSRPPDSPASSQPLARVSDGSTGISPRSVSTTTTSTPAAHAVNVTVTATHTATPSARGEGVEAPSQQQPQGGTAPKLGSGGLRGKIGQVWGNRRKPVKTESVEQEPSDGPHQARDGAPQHQVAGLGGAPGMPSVVQGSAVLQPASGEGGGFAFLPAQDRTLDAYQDWVQSRAGLAGGDSGRPAPVTLEGGNGGGGGGGGGGSASNPHEDDMLPTTPLGRSSRSFDPNMSPSTSTCDVDVSHISLPPLLGTHAALASLGASFDPNRSTRSWFDMSTESQNKLSPEMDAGFSWQQGLPSETRMLPASLSRAAAAATRENEGAAGASAAVGVTGSPGAQTDRSIAAVTPTGNVVQTEAAAAKATAAAAAAAAALPATLLNEDQLVGELSDLSISSGRRRSKARLVLASAVAPDASSVDAVSDQGSSIVHVGANVSVSGDSGSDGMTHANTPASVSSSSTSAPASASAAAVVPRVGTHHEWEGVVIGTEGRSGPSLVPPRCFSAEVVPNVAPGDPASWSADAGSLGGRPATLPNDWSLAMQQQQHQAMPWVGLGGGAHEHLRSVSQGGGGAVASSEMGLPGMVTAPSVSPLGEGIAAGSAGSAVSSAAAAGGVGVAGNGGGLAGAGGEMVIDTAGGLGREGLQLPPTSASSMLYHRSARAQSVDVGLLQTMARVRDSEMKWPGAGQQPAAAFGWPSGWPPRQGEGSGQGGDGSALPPVGSLTRAALNSALAAPSSMPQRSVSADTSMSDSRSLRHTNRSGVSEGAADGGGIRAGGGVVGGRGSSSSDGMVSRWPSNSSGGGGGGSCKFDVAFQGDNGGFQSVCPGPPTPLDGDDSVHATPLSGGGDMARESTPRSSWSALHAMIPTPGVQPGGGGGPGRAAGEGVSGRMGEVAAAAAAATGLHCRRATIPQLRSCAGEDGARRNSHAEIVGVLTGDGQGGGGGEVGGGLGIGNGRAHAAGGSSWGSAPSSFG